MWSLQSVAQVDSTANQDEAVNPRAKHPSSFDISFFPTIGYEPETRLYLGLVYQQINRSHEQAKAEYPISTLSFEFTYTWNKQRIFEIEWDQFIALSFRTEGRMMSSRFPDLYWGIGRDAADNAESYTAGRLYLDLGCYYHLIKPKLSIGLDLRYGQNKLIEQLQNGLIEKDLAQYGNRNWIGIGPAFVLDTRKNRLNPSNAAFLQVKSHLYPDGIRDMSADFRIYIGLKPEKKTILALNTYWNLNNFSNPFALTRLGDPIYFRGYYRGRYRGQAVLTNQAELRQHIYRRWGLALFGAVGRVNHQSHEAYCLPAAGAGLRFRIKEDEDFNLRVDYAIGSQSNGLYISFGEAF